MPTQNENNRFIRDAGERRWNQWCEQHAVPDALLQHTDAIIELFGKSAFVSEQCLRHPDWLTALFESGEYQQAPESDALSSQIKHTVEQVTQESDLLRTLRELRNRQMVGITWRDLANNQPISTSLKQVSVLADNLILAAYHWFYRYYCDMYGTPGGTHGPQPMLIMGMGKLGGHELNFSSDIDLIFIYPEKGEIQGARKAIEHQQFFTKLAQKLINALNKVTADGQVYRVDMRLRPFGESGPLVMHMGAVEDYYQEQGRHWERFAMIKARILNQPDAYSAQLDDILRPFTFRRYLDFTTIDALRNMKQLIATELRRRQLQDNIKLGAGGIREVEFFAQSFQLIHGGREPALREKSLLTTLDALKDLDIVSDEDVAHLKTDYLFLRKAEHTLQQLNDEQTQLLPSSEPDQSILAEVMGFESYNEFLNALNSVMERVHDQFRSLIEETHDSHGEDDTLFDQCQDAWRGNLDQQEFIPVLSPPLSQEDADTVYRHLADFRQSLRRYRMGQRGEDTLNKLMPELLYVLASENPDKAGTVLRRILIVIHAVTGRTTYLDLLLENTDVLRQLVRLCERSEWITDQIARFPLLLDELLTPLYLEQQNTHIEESRAHYIDELRQALLRVDPLDTELMMDTWRQFKLCQQLRIAASDISGSLPIANVSDKLTVLAEVILHSVIIDAWQQLARRYGEPAPCNEPEMGFAVIAYGKLGGYELGYGSDLDLVFVHNADSELKTNGEKAISAQQFYIKLAQKIMHLLNTTTLSGQLYETDLRLRPSGNAGLLCCHINGFKQYQENEAWTWEHQALVRARGIFGDTRLLDDFAEIRDAVLQRQREPGTLKQDVSSMRSKMRDHMLKRGEQGVDLKQCEGGITDIEFLTQYWVLAHSHDHPTLTRFTDNLRILDDTQAQGIISASQLQTLQEAYLSLRDTYHQLTLADSEYADETDEIAEMRRAVSAVWEEVLGENVS